ncbi:MAG: helix-turn-helix transcriptional regulator [Alistipes sp.]|nr:helix-turn-helix transcriptional regulator [Alistipes sp.]
MGDYIRDEELIREIALRMKRFRMEKGLPHSEVYIDTDINTGRVENGKSSTSVSVLKKLCTYYGKTLEELFRGL